MFLTFMPLATVLISVRHLHDTEPLLIVVRILTLISCPVVLPAFRIPVLPIIFPEAVVDFTICGDVPTSPNSELVLPVSLIDRTIFVDLDTLAMSHAEMIPASLIHRCFVELVACGFDAISFRCRFIVELIKCFQGFNYKWSQFL